MHVHSGLDLLAADCDGLSDPYCVVMANKQKVLTCMYALIYKTNMYVCTYLQD